MIGREIERGQEWEGGKVSGRKRYRERERWGERDGNTTVKSNQVSIVS